MQFLNKKGQALARITQYLKVSKTTDQLKQTHNLLLKILTRTQQRYILPFLLAHLLQLSDDDLLYARHLLDKIPNCRTQFLWNCTIRNHVNRAQFSQSIVLYAKMHRRGVLPSGFTFSSVLNACARVPAVVEGKQTHTRLLQSGFLDNKIVKTALLDMYAKCGFVLDACRVFETMDERDAVAWTAMICGYTKVGMMDEARRLFDGMEEQNVVSWSAMVAGYANCGDMRAARELYDVMVERNSVTWIAMIAGYGKCGDVREARRVFDGIAERDESCWAAMVACYAQNGYAKEAIEMYEAMREGNVGLTEVAMVGAISACAQLGDVDLGNKLANIVEEMFCGIKSSTGLDNCSSMLGMPQ
ncbi:hypothetical protein Tsubulata_045077 [Turnera subulata]|uniref:Pentacotripeptide-repeat region of PRORP domain-containing protein n=1 Tax=Turnera subulata TaxID=218843 RepID=A0A9Q0FHG2_9ROSI|nr:hypothetical protein Tsubulata_045077 [Turnera subulata]